MTEITRVSLKNEMDIVIAHQRMISVARFFSLPVSIQSTIASSIAEVSRIVVDKTDRGLLCIGVEKGNGRFLLIGHISFPPNTDIGLSEEGLQYAQLLVPEFHFDNDARTASIIVGIWIPRSLKLNNARIEEAAEFFSTIQPITRQSRLLDEKKNEFISVASHELRTPLTSIMAFTQLALDAGETEASTKVLHYLEIIDHQVHKLHILIQQLLDISRIDSGKMDYHTEEKGWNGYMKEMVPTLTHMVPSHRLSWLPCPAEVLVCIDVLRIEQVLINLVNNAAKYSHPDTNIDISCSSDSQSLTICVRDEGIGISKNNVSRIFDKYFREESVADKYSGFGMGLYIASAIIREHNGAIWAEKNQKAGSSFYFSLPISVP